MMDVIQKMFLAGLGATVTTAEAVAKTLEELVEKGKISAEEAKSYSEKMMSEGKKEFDTVREDAAVWFEKMLHKSQVATQKQVADLEAKVAKLAERVAALEGKGE